MGRRKITFFQRIAYILEYIVVVPFAGLLSLIPRRWLPAFSRPIGWLIYKINKKDKKWAYYNLDIVYKDNPLTWEEKDKIVRQLYRNLIIIAIEYLQLGRITAKNYHKYVEYENYHESLERLQKEGRPSIAVTLHLGNWEVMGTVFAKLGLNLAVVINRQWNPYTDKWLKNIREKKGKIKSFYNEISEVKNIARHLQNKGCIALVADQTYYFKPLIVPFFGVPAGTAEGPAKFHLKYKAPIVMAYSYRQANGKYKVIYEDPVEFESTGDHQADHERIMTWINKKYESYILQHIDQWFSLLHARWERTTAEEFEELDFDPF